MRTVLLVACLALAGCTSESPAADPKTLDSDGDGFTDAVERDAGSDPQNATSVPIVRVSQDVSFSDSGLIVAGAEDPVGAGCGATGEPGIAAWTWTIAAPAGTAEAHVTDLVFIATYPPTMPEGDIYVFNPDGQLITSTTSVSIPPSSTDRVTVDSKQSAGDFRIEVRGCAGAGEVGMEATGTLSYLERAQAAA